MSIQSIEAARPTQQGRREGGLTPHTIEIEIYLDLPKLNNSKVDVLGWWKAQQHMSQGIEVIRHFWKCLGN
jgi:hypothetical protein